MVDMEIWKDVKGYEGYYQISNMGNVRSVDRVRRKSNHGYDAHIKGKVIKQRSQKNGYKCVTIYKDGVAKTVRVHRLVAAAFVPNPNGYGEVNHIDENVENNCANNLEWCSRSYNCSYGSGLSKRAKKCSKPCVQYKDGIEIARFPSISEASRKTGIVFSSIQSCVSGKQKTTHGFTWSAI